MTGRRQRHYTLDDYQRDMAKLYRIRKSDAPGVSLLLNDALAADFEIAQAVEANEVDVAELELAEFEVAELEREDLERTEREQAERERAVFGLLGADMEPMRPSDAPPPVSVIQARRGTEG